MDNNRNNITKFLNFLNPNKKSSSVSPQQSYNHDYEWSAAISALDLSDSLKYRIGEPITTFKSSSSSSSSLSSSPTSSSSSSSFSYSYPPSPNANNQFGHRSSQNMPTSTTKTNESSLIRSASMQRRSSVSNCHENSKKRLLRAKKAEYEEKMQAFDELINKRRGINLRSTLAYDVASY